MSSESLESRFSQNRKSDAGDWWPGVASREVIIYWVQTNKQAGKGRGKGIPSGRNSMCKGMEVFNNIIGSGAFDGTAKFTRLLPAHTFILRASQSPKSISLCSDLAWPSCRLYLCPGTTAHSYGTQGALSWPINLDSFTIEVLGCSFISWNTFAL